MAKAAHKIRLTKQAGPEDRRARRALSEALKKFEPRIAVAFGRAVASILGQPGIVKKLTDAINAGDVTGVQEIVGNDRLALAMKGEGIDPEKPSFQNELIAALQAGGVAGAVEMGRARALAVGSLSLTNPEAIKYLAENMPIMIREISEESRRVVQAALLRGFDEGRPAAKIARDIRDVVGLTEAQGQAVTNFRRQIETGTRVGSPVSSRRLSATDRAVANMLYNQAAAGQKPSQARVDQIVGRYAASLRNRRGKNIARTEATRAFGAGKQALWDQAVERGLLDPAKTRRHWLITPDERLREEHAAVPGMNPDGVGLDEPFSTPIGPVAGPRESGVAGFDVNCRCTVVLKFLD